jgi:TPR repeat protein
MFSRVFVFFCLLALLSPANAQDALIVKVIPALSGLNRAEILLAIGLAEDAIAKELKEAGRSVKTVHGKEKEEHFSALLKHSAFCYRALGLLFEKTEFPNIAAIYRARATLYDDLQQKKINPTQFEQSIKQNEWARLQALPRELTVLQKDNPPKPADAQPSQTFGSTLGNLILTAASQELGDLPDVHAFNQGMIALGREDHAKATELLRPLAERGNPRAQFWIGHFYSEGKGGLPKSGSEAFKWFQRAADQNEPFAQYYLAGMYLEVRRDAISAYMWLSLSAAQGNERAAKGLGEITPYMTVTQIAEAKQRASEWKPPAR